MTVSRSPAAYDAMPMHHLAVGAVLRDAAGRLLLVRQFSGLWTLTGGVVESTEDPVSAVRREVEEEVGLTVVPTLRAVDWFPPAGSRRRGLAYYLFEAPIPVGTGIEADPAEIADWEFVSADEALRRCDTNISRVLGCVLESPRPGPGGARTGSRFPWRWEGEQ
ncbi:NUDIX hydrolase [Kribbella sp. NPDC051718]|uniref:NUDIX hydrolase n=1 Tax=Kribbella sp. NPDC051718 TaxID=3155168 RepID=UPI00344508C0